MEYWLEIWLILGIYDNRKILTDTDLEVLKYIRGGKNER